MPHLHVTLNRPLSDDDRERLTDWVTAAYADVMATDTDHVAVSIREQQSNAISLGRAEAGDPVAILDADIREGRSYGQRERFANAVVDRLEDWIGVPRDHCHVVYTEHPAEDFLLDEGPLDSWSAGDDDAGATE